MKEDLKNRISYAIKKAMDLGFDLCDVDFSDEKTIDQDLTQNDHSFKDLNILDNINYIIDQYLLGWRNTFPLLKQLCYDYCDDYYGIYDIGSDCIALHDLIVSLCGDFGNNLNLNWINVKNIEQLYYSRNESDEVHGLFQDTRFNGDISQWDVRNVTEMYSAFRNSKFNGDISKWNVSNCYDMSYMFYESKFNQDISQWDVSHVEDMCQMFAYSEFNQDIDKWNVGNVVDMSYMFYGSVFNKSLAWKNVTYCHDMSYMFARSKFNNPSICQWDVSFCTVMNHMFTDSVFNQDISKWEIKTTNLLGIWENCPIDQQNKPITKTR